MSNYYSQCTACGRVPRQPDLRAMYAEECNVLICECGADNVEAVRVFDIDLLAEVLEANHEIASTYDAFLDRLLVPVRQDGEESRLTLGVQLDPGIAALQLEDGWRDGYPVDPDVLNWCPPIDPDQGDLWAMVDAVLYVLGVPALHTEEGNVR